MPTCIALFLGIGNNNLPTPLKIRATQVYQNIVISWLTYSLQTIKVAPDKIDQLQRSMEEDKLHAMEVQQTLTGKANGGPQEVFHHAQDLPCGVLGATPMVRLALCRFLSWAVD